MPLSQDHGTSLFRLVYVSRAVLPAPSCFEETVERVLDVAQPKNGRFGVTGLLLAHQGWFLQTLEGPRRNVSQIFGEIGRDLRHTQLELLGAGPAPSRLFAEWSMCARQVTPEAGPVLAELDLTPDFDPFRLEAEVALRLLTAISQLPQRKAA